MISAIMTYNLGDYDLRHDLGDYDLRSRDDLHEAAEVFEEEVRVLVRAVGAAGARLVRG